MGKKIDLKRFGTKEENIRKLEPEQVKPYLDGLNKRLTELSKILVREDDEFVCHYIAIVQETMNCLALKHELAGPDQMDFSLTIDPTESGFPTVKDFYLLEKDKENAESALANLPPKDEITDMIRNNVLRSRSPEHGQILLKRHNYYSKLLETNLLKEYHLNEPKFIEEKNRKRSFTLEWCNIERGYNVPIFYRMYLYQDASYYPLDKEPSDKLKTIIYQSHYGMMDLRTLVSIIDKELDEIHPKLIYKYVIGPYHNSVTWNTEELDKILGSSDEQSILKFRKEAVASTMVRKFGGRIRKWLGKQIEKEIYGPLDDSDKRMIVPFRVKQKLGDKDEYEKPCKVYGVTKEGDIID